MGSNPWGFAAPAGKELPVMLDMATSTVAGGKVFAINLETMAAVRTSRSLPANAMPVSATTKKTRRAAAKAGPIARSSRASLPSRAVATARAPRNPPPLVRREPAS